MGTAWKRVQKICYTLKTFCYAQQQAAFLSKDWTLFASFKIPKEKETEKQLEKALKENAQLKKSHDQLKSKVLKLSNAVKNVKKLGTIQHMHELFISYRLCALNGINGT